MDDSVTEPAKIYLLGLDSEAEAVKLAQKIADKTGRKIEVRDSDSDLIEIVCSTRH